MNVTVISPGLLTTIQDLGRHGLQQFGLPVCGVMDSYSAQAANALVGNKPSEALLEITLQGPVLKLQGEGQGLIALTGGEASLTINGNRFTPWQSHLIQSGDEIAVGPITVGARAYLAFAGGIDVPLVMGSRSTFLRGAIGGLEGRALRSGDSLDLVSGASLISAGSFVPRQLHCRLPQGNTKTVVRVMVGPQDACFLPESLASFFTDTYQVTGESDRMGYRLSGPTLKHLDKADIVSDGIAPGSIQVPGHGQPIIMLADRQSTGGYTKIATIITADLPLLGQMKPGDTLSFVQVAREVAVKALREQQEMLAKLPHASGRKRRFQVRVAGELFTAVAEEL